MKDVEEKKEDVPNEMITLYREGAESDGAGLHSKRSELQKLLEINGETRVSHYCWIGFRRRLASAEVFE
jgi:hypothetical protein